MVEQNLDSEQRKRKLEKILIVVTVVIILGLTIFEANIARSITNIPFFGNVLVFIVINLNVLLIVFLLFLVSRNFFKLFLERKRNVLGSKIRYKLVVTFLVFSLIPMVFFFFVSYRLTTSSIKTFIGSQVGEGLKSSILIAREYIAREERELVDYLTDLNEGRKRIGADSGIVPDVLVEYGQGGLKTVRGDGAGIDFEEFTRYAGSHKEGGQLVHTQGNHIFAGVERQDGSYLIAVKKIPENIYKELGNVSTAYSAYSQFRILNDPIKATNLGILIMVTLLIIFTNTWIGFYLARDFSIPLKKLAEGTEKLSKGREMVTIEHASDDEFGLLVESFNRMAREMVHSREELETLNRALEASYYELSIKADLIEAIISGISTGVITIDKSGRVSMINQVARDILGVRGDVEGVNYRECFSQSAYEDIRKEIGVLKPGVKETASRQVRFSSEGKEKELIVRTTILKKGEMQYQGVVITLDDISDIKRMQEIAAWGEVARKVAHEIKNPLTPIKLSAQRLKKKFEHYGEGEENQVFNECIDTIVSEVDMIGKLVDEFSRFARMPATRRDRGDLHLLARQILNNYMELYPQIEFSLSVNGTIPKVEFDPANMKRVFVNLLENSIWAIREAGDSGGNVSMALSFDEDLGNVVFTLDDTGIGIDEENREDIFKLHYSTKEEGQGLGLSIVKTIIDDHEGRVYAARPDHGGARIVIELPVSKELM